MNDILSSLFTPDELGRVAYFRANFDYEFEHFSSLHSEDGDLNKRANAALERYLQAKLSMLDAMKEADAPAGFEAPAPDLKFKKACLAQLQTQIADNGGRYSQSERCDIIHRLTESIRLSMEGKEVSDTSAYTGPVSDEAEGMLAEELCELLAIANTSQRDMNRLTSEMFECGASTVGRNFTQQLREDILKEAQSIYMAAHEGKLQGFSSQTSIEECVSTVLLCEDVDALQKAAKRGSIAYDAVSFIVPTLLICAMMASIFLLGPHLLILAGKASALLEALYVFLAMLAIFVPTIATVAYEECDSFQSIIDRLLARINRRASLIAIMLPLKHRKRLARAAAEKAAEYPEAAEALAMDAGVPETSEAETEPAEAKSAEPGVQIEVISEATLA